MSGGPGSRPPERVPTLTEVIAWPESAPASAAAAAPSASAIWSALPLPNAEPPPSAESSPTVEPPTPLAPEAAAPPPRPMPALRQPEEQLIHGVLAEVQRQVDLMLEYRLREVLTPLLTRAADTLVRDARAELASALRDVVDRAVAQEIARHRGG